MEAKKVKNIIVVVKDGVVITTMHKRNKFRISEKRVPKLKTKNNLGDVYVSEIKSNAIKVWSE